MTVTMASRWLVGLAGMSGAIATLALGILHAGIAKAHPIPALNSDEMPIAAAADTAQDFQVVYPPAEHRTVSDRIFFIGSGDPSQSVTVVFNNSAPVTVHQSPGGNFAPSFPLAMGENRFILRQGDRTITRLVTRVSRVTPPGDQGWVESQILPQGDLGRLPGEQLCFRATGLTDFLPLIRFFGGRSPFDIPLVPQDADSVLLDNKAALVDQTDPDNGGGGLGFYAGCQTLPALAGNYGSGTLRGGQGPLALGALEILDPDQLPMVEVTAIAGVARTGPSTNHSRLTPLPQGTRATVTGYDGEWLRLSYGAWIRQRETRTIAHAVSLPARLRSVTSRPPKTAGRGVTNPRFSLDNATEIRFPLDRTVPVSLTQGDRHVTLTLHNTIAETDIVAVSRDRAVERVTWEQTEPTTLKFRVDLRGRAWGHTLRYDNNTLVLRLNHPPTLGSNLAQPLQGATILIDPGHGGEERGAIGPTGYPEKDANLLVSLALR
ncbi:MAG: N-acetylmuramoyl-L-alanine amidase, partial [Cyanobacteria bacterium P01_D01_bin.73]